MGGFQLFLGKERLFPVFRRFLPNFNKQTSLESIVSLALAHPLGGLGSQAGKHTIHSQQQQQRDANRLPARPLARSLHTQKPNYHKHNKNSHKTPSCSGRRRGAKRSRLSRALGGTGSGSVWRLVGSVRFRPVSFFLFPATRAQVQVQVMVQAKAKVFVLAFVRSYTPLGRATVF